MKVFPDEQRELLAILVISPGGKGYWFYDHRPDVVRKVLRMKHNGAKIAAIVEAINGRDCIIELIKKTEEGVKGKAVFYANLKHRKKGVKIAGVLNVGEVIDNFYALSE